MEQGRIDQQKREKMTRQYPLFIKYRREWLAEVTGFSRGYLCRVATGRYPLSRSFVERVCFKLQLGEEDLFGSDGTQPR